MSLLNTTVSSNEAKKPRHVFVFDNMRTRSHLFWRWISTHPALHSTYHPYLLACLLGPENILPKLRDTEARAKWAEGLLKHCGVDMTHEMSHRGLEKDIAEAEMQGKPLFTSEHCLCLVSHYIQLDFIRRGNQAFPSFDYAFPNPTYLPDRLMDQFVPVILIRHPVSQIQSLYTSLSANSGSQPGGENFACCSSLHLSRLLFEYFRLARGRPPIVIDGEDTLWRTEEMGHKFCEAVGISTDSLKEEWERLPDTWWEGNEFVLATTKTVHESTGIERPKEKPESPDKDRTFREWTERYGYEVARHMMERVDLAMPHYEYLVQYKL